MEFTFFSGKEKFVLDKPIRLIELFAGIGSQAMALKELGVDFEHYQVCEFDKYALLSYNVMHNTAFETSDITQLSANDLGIVDIDKFCYVVTYGFPCQDLSVAGGMAGMNKGENTRSGLLWEVERLLDECDNLPQILLMENVPLVVGNKNIHNFAKWIEKLEKIGYKNYWQVLNAVDYGIPQKRRRCFMVSILGDYYCEFPSKIELKQKIDEFLEDEVSSKYYLSEKMVKYLSSEGTKNYNRREVFLRSLRNTNTDGIANTILTTAGSRATDNYILEMPLVTVEEEELKDYIESDNGIFPTLTTRGDTLGFYKKMRIRKLTPRECFRLMGFRDKYFNRAEKVGISDSQFYKQTGNSIVVSVLMAIFGKLFGIEWESRVRVLVSNLVAIDTNKLVAVDTKGR